MAPFNTGPSVKGIQILAIPAVILLVLTLGYSSQWLFYSSPDLLPGPPSTFETATFNVLLLCLWYTYYKACTVDPGRYSFPDSASSLPNVSSANSDRPPDALYQTPRHCKKCRAPKPPRAHHCRHCGRCIPKMDHHCPWTGNCVSLTTFPYFLRFLVWTNLSLWFLGWLLSRRAAALWAARHLPAYLGPTLPQLVHLVLLALLDAAVALALGILLYTTARGWALNMTMIEGWELERHEALLDRYEGEEGRWWAGGDEVLRLERVEFPYDVGMFANMAQAMGTANPLLWFWPLAGGLTVSPGGRGVGWAWPENGFNAREGMWPPLDPEKLRRAARVGWPGAAARLSEEQAPADGDNYGSPEEVQAAFRARQAEDFRRRHAMRMRIVEELEEEMDDELVDVENDGDDYDEYEEGIDGEPGWTNADGERLKDYGVDEDVEDEDLIPVDLDEDVPLAELVRRRKILSTDGEG